MSTARKEHTEPSTETPPENESLGEVRDAVHRSEESSGETQEDEEKMDWQAAVAEVKDKYLRLLAEFDNYKKRTMRERLDLMASAGKDTMLALLPVLDDFDRARKAAEANPERERFSEGVQLVYTRLYNVLQARGLKALESNGEPFDPEWHEAITEIPAPAPELKGKVVDTIEKGYLLNETIIRYAKVVVGN